MYEKNILLLSTVICGAPLWLNAAEIGAPAPELKVCKFVQGKPLALPLLKGKKVVVLHFWSTKCPPCDKIAPVMNRIGDNFRGKNVEFVAIGSDTPENIAAYLKKHKLTMTVAADDMFRTANSYLRSGDRLPSDVIIGRDGKVLWIGPSVALHGALNAVLDGSYDLAGAVEFDRFDRAMESCAKLKDYAGALKLLDERLRKFPGDAVLIEAKSNILAHYLNSSEKALIFLTQEIGKFPKEFKLHEARLKLLAERKQTNKPMQDAYNEIAANFTDRPLLLVQLADNMMRRNAGSVDLVSVYTLARTAWDKGKFADNQERARAAATLARSYYYVGMPERAVIMQKEAVRLGKDGRDIKRFRGDLEYYMHVRAAGEEIARREK